MQLPHLPTGRLSFLYAALFFEVGIALPFFPIWLEAQSLDASQIGIVLAAPLLARIVANPLVGAYADRHGAIGSVLTIAAAAVAVFNLLLGLASGFVAILCLVILAAFAQGPLIALTDTHTWMLLRDRSPADAHERLYGRIRLWGSIGFIAASLSAGYLTTRTSADAIIWFIVLAAFATAAAALFVSRYPSTPSIPAGEASAGVPRAAVVALLAGAVCVQSSHAMYYAFSSLHWVQTGISATLVGALWAISVVSEIVLFWFARLLFARFGSPRAVLLFAGIVAALRWSIMALDPPLPVLVVLQLTQGITFGATHLATMVTIARAVPRGAQARAQSWVAAGWAASLAGLTALCGGLYPDLGEHTYWLMATTAAAGLGLFLVGRAAESGPIMRQA